jgi:haloacetate dehalogenase
VEIRLNPGLIDGFAQRRLPGHGVEIDALVGGSGPPLLLLHGAPQTRVCWSKVASALAERFTLVIPDLRGYGRSDKPRGGGDHGTYSKRMLGLDQIATMDALGFKTFGVAGHDRGGRVAYRLALDHPARVGRLAVLDIVPTVDAMEAFDRHTGLKLWHWAFQALDEPIPERLIGNDADFYTTTMLRAHAAPGFTFEASHLADYLDCMRDPAAIHAMCEDYRAAWTCDRALDEAEKGVRKLGMPVLALWGAQTAASRSPLAKWEGWATDLRGEAFRCGHFLAEEAPVETARALSNFFG